MSFTAPVAIASIDSSEDSLTVHIKVMGMLTAVMYYKITITNGPQDKYCETAPFLLSCTISDLSLTTYYTLEARACAKVESDKVCNNVIVRSHGYTIPQGKIIFE